MQCEIDDVLATTETSRNDHSSETTTFLHAGMHRLPELTLMEVQWVTDVGIEARYASCRQSYVFDSGMHKLVALTRCQHQCYKKLTASRNMTPLFDELFPTAGMHKLVALTLGEMQRVTNAGIEAVSELHLPALKRVRSFTCIQTIL